MKKGTLLQTISYRANNWNICQIQGKGKKSCNFDLDSSHVNRSHGADGERYEKSAFFLDRDTTNYNLWTLKFKQRNVFPKKRVFVELYYKQWSANIMYLKGSGNFWKQWAFKFLC